MERVSTVSLGYSSHNRSVADSVTTTVGSLVRSASLFKRTVFRAFRRKWLVEVVVLTACGVERGERGGNQSLASFARAFVRRPNGEPCKALF